MMKRYFFNLVASLAVGGTILISVPLAQAGGKGGFSMGGSKGGSSMRSSMGSGKSMNMSRLNVSRSLGSQSIASRSVGTKVATQGVSRNLTTTKHNLHKFGGQHVTKHNLGTRTIANHGKLTGLHGKINGTKFDHGKFNGGLHGKLTGNFGNLPTKFPGKWDGKLDGNFGKLPKFPGKPGGIVGPGFPKPHFPTPPFCPPGLPPYHCPPVCQPGWGGGWGGWCDWIPGFGNWGGNCGPVPYCF
jgi:hypothetical protein